ncbi:MAG: hypothetical protein OEW64_06690 [Gammaproteobacteria bacterium]|nr:hypothetical protein [Gammaproteobacteria bacterium]MDH5303767.1 hypothetical protein [Gammaproteobacteria bacterium]MDH5323156.1 hypothetical protein [Gammaproteobacteria bacterium]
MTDREDKLMRAARGLATGISPARDLWPGIEQAISAPRKSRWSPMLAQAAAAVLLVGASSLVTYVAVKYDAGDTPAQVMTAAAPQGLIFDRAAFGGEDTLAAVYGRAGGNIGSMLDRELASLSPEAREDVERNLAVIRRAIEEIATALEKEPDNVFLQELLVEAYSNELALMNRIGSMAQRVMARRDI